MNHLVAIGDIHGHREKLTALTEAVKAYMITTGLRFGNDWNFIFIGDYIDRGPDSMGTVEQVQQFEADGAICLMGNHERFALDDRYPYDPQTLESYGCFSDTIPMDSVFFDHLEWFATLPVFFETGNHFFVHAGIRPDVPLDEQKTAADQTDLLWIREAFLDSQKTFEKYVVHGHSMTRQPIADVRHNRCNLDTGAGYGRRLSAAVFDLAQQQPVHRISV